MAFTTMEYDSCPLISSPTRAPGVIQHRWLWCLHLAIQGPNTQIMDPHTSE